MLSCQDINKTYETPAGDVPVLKGLNFEVKTGEFVAIMGPSGSGKSTLMNILGCLDVPSAGRYLLDGADVSDLDDDELADVRARKIGFVFQSFNLLPRASVYKNVTLPLMYSGVDPDKRAALVEGALDAAAFPRKFWHLRPNQLSGGMTQRVAIARALVNDPAIILADEPTGNLDSQTGEAVLASFQALNEERGRTIIMITHEPYVAEHANRIIHLKDGAIISDDTSHARRAANHHPHDHE
jgi:putative ABC transport system ATP-binding protein